MTALESEFPIVKISQIAERESWRKEINRPIYHIHKWWAKRLGSVFRAITLGALSNSPCDIWKDFYKKHQLTGKIVLDPFMGSGTTLGEAIKLGARAIGCDINPVSTFLVRQAFTRVPENKLRQAFQMLKDTVASQIQYYYQTQDPITGELIPVLYFFWVKTVETPDGETIPLLSSYVFSQDAYPKKKPKAQILCPKCWNIIEDRYDATEVQCPRCKYHFDPQKGPASGQYVISKSGRYRIKDLLPIDGSPPVHKLYAILALQPNGKKIYLPARPDDLARFKEAEERLQKEELLLPTLLVRPGYNTDQARGYNYTHWRDFFNARQLLCLGLLANAILTIEEKDIQEQMLCLFSSTLEFNNLFCSFKGEGTGAVRHMFSNHTLKPERAPLENSVWGSEKSSGTFCSLFESRLIRAKRYLDEPFEINLEYDISEKATAGSKKIIASNPIHVKCVESWEQFTAINNSIMILNGDSSKLPIPDVSVDAIVTDPPYFDFVHYSELSDFFFAWLSPLLQSRYSWLSRLNSSDKGEVQHKDPRVFSKQLALVFSECHRVLKDNGILTFSFHHSRAEGWAAIHEAITTAGFVVVATHPVHAELRAATTKTGTKDPISLDAILVCKKRKTLVNAELSDKTKIFSHTLKLAGELKKAGLKISKADRFVIGASLTLTMTSAKSLSYEETKEIIEEYQANF